MTPVGFYCLKYVLTLSRIFLAEMAYRFRSCYCLHSEKPFVRSKEEFVSDKLHLLQQWVLSTKLFLYGGAREQLLYPLSSKSSFTTLLLQPIENIPFIYHLPHFYWWVSLHPHLDGFNESPDTNWNVSSWNWICCCLLVLKLFFRVLQTVFFSLEIFNCFITSQFFIPAIFSMTIWAVKCN